MWFYWAQNVLLGNFQVLQMFAESIARFPWNLGRFLADHPKTGLFLTFPRLAVLGQACWFKARNTDSRGYVSSVLLLVGWNRSSRQTVPGPGQVSTASKVYVPVSRLSVIELKAWAPCISSFLIGAYSHCLSKEPGGLEEPDPNCYLSSWNSDSCSRRSFRVSEPCCSSETLWSRFLKWCFLRIPVSCCRLNIIYPPPQLCMNWTFYFSATSNIIYILIFHNINKKYINKYVVKFSWKKVRKELHFLCHHKLSVGSTDDEFKLYITTEITNASSSWDVQWIMERILAKSLLILRHA